MNVRRVVTATNEAGQSYFMVDGPAGNVSRQPGRGLVFHELWVTGGPLANNEGSLDSAAGPVEHHPPVGGSRVRIVEFMPDSQQNAALANDDFAAIGALTTLVGDQNDVSMHRNETVDYNIIIRGEIFAKTDLGELLLKPGDVLIQRGTSHTWHNRSNEPCVFASVMVSAAPLRGASADHQTSSKA